MFDYTLIIMHIIILKACCCGTCMVWYQSQYTASWEQAEVNLAILALVVNESNFL